MKEPPFKRGAAGASGQVEEVEYCLNVNADAESVEHLALAVLIKYFRSHSFK